MAYNISLISFFDILGFGNIVDTANDTSKVLKILEALKYEATPDKESASTFEMKFANFSDSVVRTTNILSESNREYQSGILFSELLILVHIQSTLIFEDVFVRGCVTVDKIYQDESYIFGPGLNRAYRLEKNIAIFPRIIIDPRVFMVWEQTPALKAGHHNLLQEKEYIRALLRESSDGVWFLDYLVVMGREYDDYTAYGKFLKHHKDLIVKCSKKFEDLDDVAVKYTWLARYHNEVIESLHSKAFKLMKISREDLRITKEEVKMIYQF